MDFSSPFLSFARRKYSASEEELITLISYSSPLTPKQQKLASVEASGVPILLAEDGIVLDNCQSRRLSLTGELEDGNSHVMTIFVAILVSTVGAGILGIPYAFSIVGPTAAMVGLCLAACMMCYTGELIVDVHNETGMTSMEECAVSTMGSKWSFVVPTVLCFGIFGASVSYVAIITDLIPTLQSVVGLEPGSSSFFMSPWLWTVVIFAFIIFPLTTAKSISSLRFSNFICLGFSLYIVGEVILMSFTGNGFGDASNASAGDDYVKVVPSIWSSISSFVKALSIFNFAFVFHLNIMPLYVTMKDRSPQKMKWTMRSAIVCTTIIYGLFGYIASEILGSNTEQNILVNFTSSRLLFAKLAAIGVMMLVFPLTFYPLKEMVHAFLFSDKETSSDGPRMGRVAESFILISIILFLGNVVPGVSVVFAVTGATAVVGICYIFPAIFHIRLANKTVVGFVVTCSIAIFAIIVGLLTTLNTLLGF